MIPAAPAPLVSHLAQSTIFAVVAGLLTLAVRNNQARIRYWLWMTASYKFLFPFSWLVSVGHLFQWRAASAIMPSILITKISGAEPAPNHQSVLVFVVGVVWTCGFLAVATSWVREWLRIRAIVRAASPLPLVLPISVVSTPGRLEPGVFGIFGSVLLLPEGIENQLSQTQLQGILAHELCHVRRRDNLTAAIHMLVEAVFWFHPLVWWLGVRMVDERERACDEYVLQACADAQAYAESILRVCEFYLESPLTCVSGITGSDLKKRMERIMRNHIGENLKTRKKLLLATAGVVALALPVAAGSITPRLRAQSAAVAADQPTLDAASLTLSDSEQSVNAKLRSRVYQAGKDGVGYPVCAYCPSPEYSDQALKARFEGPVVLQAVITEKGRASKIKVVKDPGFGLEDKATEVVKRWKFKPANGPDGNPVAVDVHIEVTFRLPTNQRREICRFSVGMNGSFWSDQKRFFCPFSPDPRIEGDALGHVRSSAATLVATDQCHRRRITLDLAC